jgi:hypothetical protein
MDFSIHDYYTPDQILFEVLNNIGDVESKKLHLGWYHSQLQHCLEELSFDTLFFERRDDVPVPANFQHQLAQGTFNVKEVYGYNGNLCDDGQMTKIWHKKNFVTKGGRVIAKNRQDGSHDPFYQSHRQYERSPYTLELGLNGRPLSATAHYYNVENGVLMLSSSTAQFESLHIRSSGISANLGDTPFIPQVFRTTCVDYVTEAASRALIAQGVEPKLYQYLQQLYSNRMDKDGFNGSWHKAASMIAKMSSGEKNDYKEYIARWKFVKY